MARLSPFDALPRCRVCEMRNLSVRTSACLYLLLWKQFFLPIHLNVSCKVEHTLKATNSIGLCHSNSSNCCCCTSNISGEVVVVVQIIVVVVVSSSSKEVVVVV